MQETDVLIIGAGPVGLTLAIDLGQRGVRCMIIEAKDKPRHLPKMERCNARSMEIYRRLGLAERIREASFPLDARMDVCVMTRMSEPPLVRLEYPSVADSKAMIAACRDGSLPLEPYQVVSQYTLEPLLKSVAETISCVTVRFSCGLLSFEQDDTGVTSIAETEGGGRETIRAKYMVGCDGGRSTVRKQLGIALEGEGRIVRRNQVFFRCDDFFAKCPSEQARMYFFANKDKTVITVQDDLKHFSATTDCWGDEKELKAVLQEVIGYPVDLTVLAATPWNLNLLVAERYMDRRVLMAGDSVHLVIPSGGLGLNTGIGDATDLAWKLAAVLQGWGGPTLLASYEVERLPVGRRNRDASRYATQGQQAWRTAIRSFIGENTPEGRGTRGALVRLASVEQRKTHEMVGTELGYCYSGSDIIIHEDTEAPPDIREYYVPSARPGYRLPHMWLSDGSAVQDKTGKGFTLLRFRPESNSGDELLRAFQAIGAPIEILDLADPALRAIYGADLILLRPDLHVAFRGDHDPENAAAVAAIVTGHGKPSLPTGLNAAPANNVSVR